MGSILSDAWKKYTPAGIIYSELTDNGKKSITSVIDDGKNAAVETWEDHKDEIGLTLPGTVYNVVTGNTGTPAKIRHTISEVATNAVDTVTGIGDDTAKFVKKYWPFAVAGVAGLVLLKSATPAIINNLFKK